MFHRLALTVRFAAAERVPANLAGPSICSGGTPGSIGFVDATVVATAERLGITRILSMDRRESGPACGLSRDRGTR